MIITHLELQNFRNHLHTKVSWNHRLNVITGPNGAGKTNLIDAIHYLCMSRSFVATSDQYVIAAGEKEFTIKGRFEGSIRSAFQTGCSYSRADGKKITVNDSPLDRLSDLIGRVPVVVLSPDDKKLTREGPAERRTFTDSFISQLSPAYLRDLIDLRRILRQRNSLLSNTKLAPTMLRTMLEPWDEQLIQTGSRIVHRRAVVLANFSRYLEEGYRLIADIRHHPTLTYRTFLDDQAPGEPIPDPEAIAAMYRELLNANRDRDIERQQTTIGPHRDDVIFYLNGRELRKFGSQGQHRLFALALKLAQRAYFADELDDLPIFLLDDVFGDLDPQKTAILVEMLLSEPGQTFITAANQILFQGLISDDSNCNFYEIDGKTMTCRSDAAAVEILKLHEATRLSADPGNDDDDEPAFAAGFADDAEKSEHTST